MLLLLLPVDLLCVSLYRPVKQERLLGQVGPVMSPLLTMLYTHPGQPELVIATTDQLPLPFPSSSSSTSASIPALSSSSSSSSPSLSSTSLSSTASSTSTASTHEVKNQGDLVLPSFVTYAAFAYIMQAIDSGT
jgi:hypothetical protein